jgi:hypothetical protein
MEEVTSAPLITHFSHEPQNSEEWERGKAGRTRMRTGETMVDQKVVAWPNRMLLSAHPVIIEHGLLRSKQVKTIPQPKILWHPTRTPSHLTREICLSSY